MKFKEYFGFKTPKSPQYLKKTIFLFLFIPLIGYCQTPITDFNIREAVSDWVFNPSSAEAKYGNISFWDVSNVTDMSSMFVFFQLFNQDISGWDVSSVTDMNYMFGFSQLFNQDIGGWDVSNVIDVNSMFNVAIAFNQNIGGWDVSNVINMSHMFSFASVFNQDISGWDVGNVNSMTYMFSEATSFNQNIGRWDVSNVYSMERMFDSATSFNMNLGSWDVSNVQSMIDMFNYTGISVRNFDETVIGWFDNATSLPYFIELSGNVAYCQSDGWLELLEYVYGWNIPRDENGLNGGFYLDCSTASLVDENQLVVSIYPNPTSNTLFITGNEGPISVSIYNTLGKEVLTVKNTNSIDVKVLPKGVYMIKISDRVRQTNSKFINN